MKLFVIGGLPAQSETVSTTKDDEFKSACFEIGRSLVAARHTVVLCSPFEDAADIHVLRGVVASPGGRGTRIEFHFVELPQVLLGLEQIISELGLTNVSKIPHTPPESADAQAVSYAWLLCQLNALESSHATIAIGGKIDGAANMLLLLAEGKRKCVLPLPFMGGAAKQSFDRCRYQLKDRLGSKFNELCEPSSAISSGEYVVTLTDGNATHAAPGQSLKFFVSYARGRQADADHVEILLRRRKLNVFRDESDFGAGHAIPNAIQEAIYGANVFIALWSAEYACSPWCFDEMELALDRHSKGQLELWILRVDSTRVVPSRARNLLHYDCLDRSSLEGCVLSLLHRKVSAELQ